MNNDDLALLVEYLNETLDDNDRLGSPNNEARAWSVARALEPVRHNRTVSADGKTITTTYLVTVISETVVL